MSVSVSGLILPKAVFDLHVSVSCLFGPKDADRLSDTYKAKILETMLAQGEIIYAPPPPPISGQKAFFRGGGGGLYFEAPRGRNFIRPPLLYTPHP